MTDDRPPVLGDIQHLDGGRLVFLGTHQDEPGTWYVGFRNREGHDTRFRLSDEAMQVLIKFVASYQPTAPRPFPEKMREVPARRWVEVERNKLKHALEDLKPDRGDDDAR